MVWSFQLTPWALPAVLALLLLIREWAFLWPRRREPGSITLLALAAVTGAWALLELVATAVPDGSVKLLLYEGQLLVSALVPVAWVVFCFLVSGREEQLRAVPAGLLYLASLATMVLVIQGPGLPMLESWRVVQEPSGYRGLVVLPGPWYWVHLVIRQVAVVVGGVVVVRHLLERPANRVWALLPGLATLLVLLPGLVPLTSVEFRPWQDLSIPAFGIAVALMGSGTLRHRLLDLGPVARTLVMVELRDPLVVLDGRGRIVDLNRAAEGLLGLQVYGSVPLALGTLWASARERADRYARVSLPVHRADGPPGEDGAEPPRRAFEVTLTPLGRKDRSGGQTALLLRDITERDRMEQELRDTSDALRSANEELERLANTDALTGLANRRHFMDALARELDRSQRYDRPLSLILLDLDHFKRVNDTYGHAAGDSVLKATADVMRSVCRDVDLPARLGGEELAILLPETRTGGASALAERLRERLERWDHRDEADQPFTVTASVGVATREGHDRGSADGFLQRADAALYRAKAGGRNRVAMAGVAGDASEGLG